MWRTFRDIVRRVALVLVSVAAWLVALNVLCALVLAWRTSAPGHSSPFLDLDAPVAVPREVGLRYLGEEARMQVHGFAYEPWLLFRNPTVSESLLHTDSAGFRRTAAPRQQAGNPLDVFVFGGSTTFGYGVADAETIPSHLQRAL